MTHDEFDKEWETFIQDFNDKFDSPDFMKQLRDIAVSQSTSKDEIPLNVEHVYQQQRMDNLVKNAIARFLDFVEK